MKKPKIIQEFLDNIHKNITCKADAPNAAFFESGEWWFECEREGITFMMSYWHNYGFGLYKNEIGYGNPPSYYFDDPKLAAQALNIAFDFALSVLVSANENEPALGRELEMA